MRRRTYVTFLMSGASYATYLMWLVISYVTYLHMMFVLNAQENPYYVPYVWGKLCYLHIAIAVQKIAWEMLKHMCKTVVTKLHIWCKCGPIWVAPKVI